MRLSITIQEAHDLTQGKKIEITFSIYYYLCTIRYRHTFYDIIVYL